MRRTLGVAEQVPQIGRVVHDDQRSGTMPGQVVHLRDVEVAAHVVVVADREVVVALQEDSEGVGFTADPAAHAEREALAVLVAPAEHFNLVGGDRRLGAAADPRR